MILSLIVAGIGLVKNDLAARYIGICLCRGKNCYRRENDRQRQKNRNQSVSNSFHKNSPFNYFPEFGISRKHLSLLFRVLNKYTDLHAQYYYYTL